MINSNYYRFISIISRLVVKSKGELSIILRVESLKLGLNYIKVY